jgi:hypothetical protein
LLSLSIDVVSLFTRVTIWEAMSPQRQHLEEDILRLFHHVLTSSYFSLVVMLLIVTSL